MHSACKLLLLTSLLPLCSCLMMRRGVTHTCRITSTPPGADFQLGDHHGTTPATIELQRSRHALPFRAAAPGFREIAQTILPERAGLANAPKVAIVGFVSGLLILPGIIDIVYATEYDYPHAIHVTFARPTEGLTTLDVKRLGDT